MKKRNTHKPSSNNHLFQAWSVERLESRVMLAGEVTGVVRGTTLTLTGDAADNDFALSNSTGTLTVAAGVSMTQINVTGDLAAVRRVRINTGGGNDSISLSQLSLSGSLAVTGNGNDDITIDDSQVDGLLRVDLRQSGSRSLTIRDSNLNNGLRLINDGGNIRTTLAGTAFISGRIATTVMGTDDFLMEDSATINGSLLRTTKNGDSETIIKDQSSVSGLVRARTTGGTSDVQIIENAEIGRFRGSGIMAHRNLTYATRDGQALKADIYIPRTEGLHPAILTIHGGYWRTGSKAAMTRRARQLADRGYVVVNIDYRLAPKDPFPAQIHDVKSAITWTRENAEAYQINPNQIGTYGYSAGAHLALLAATTDGTEGLEGPDSVPGISTRVQAVVAGSPGVDFRDFDANDERLSYFLGGTINELPEAYQNVSPAHWLSADDPATMLFIGELESVVSRPKVDQFMSELNSLGITNRLYEVADKGHLPAATDPLAMMESLKFFDETLKA